MFVVQELLPFPGNARSFRDSDEVEEALQSIGLQVDTSICASCPALSRNMQVPHYFAHVYAGMEFLERGQEEWQMCQIVKKFVSENVVELKDDTKQYFKNIGGKQSVV